MVFVSFPTFVNVAHFCFCIMLSVLFVLCLVMSVVGNCFYVLYFLVFVIG
jgi:hypothetical protein